MDATGLIGSILNGGILGIGGQLATAWIRHKDRKLEIEQEAARAAAELEKIKVMGNIDADKAVMALQAEIEKGQAAGFVAAQDAEGKIRGEAPWATTVRALWRPALTGQLLVLTAVFFFASPQNSVLRADIATATVTAATSAILFWFGSRQLEKTTAAALRRK